MYQRSCSGLCLSPCHRHVTVTGFPAGGLLPLVTVGRGSHLDMGTLENGGPPPVFSPAGGTSLPGLSHPSHGP